MINELFLYGQRESVFKDICAQIPAIEDRYHVSPNYGHDLNTGNLETFIKDPAYGISDVKQKYPICVCITPNSRPIMLNGIRWEQFFFKIFFLQRTHIDSTINTEGNGNKIKNRDKDTNLSDRHVSEDWAEMKVAAMQFVDLLAATLHNNIIVDSVTYPFGSWVNFDLEKLDISRLSNFNNDKISGVAISFITYLNIMECEINFDGITWEVATLQQEVDPVWLSEKSNYYTKSQVDEKIGNEIETIAGQDLSSGRIVYINTGKAYYFDPMDFNLAGLTLGITKNAALQDDLVNIQTVGIFEETGLGLTPDIKYFIGANGSLTQTITGLKVVQQAGVSISSNKLAINFYSPIITN